MQHLDEGTIHAWLDGALPTDEAAAAEHHANACAECAALVADARGVIAGAARIVSALDDVPGGVIPKPAMPATSRSVWRTLHLTPLRAALAASLLMAAGALAVIRHAPSGTRSDIALIEKRAMPASANPAVAVAPPTAVSNKPVSEQRVRVQDQAPPAPREVAAVAPAPRREAKAIVKTDSATVAFVDSIAPAAAKAGVAGAPAASPAAPPMAMSRSVNRDATMRNAADVQTQPFSLVFTSADNRPLEPPGCYQLVRDSLDPAIPLPDRFALEDARDSVRQRNVMRALTLDGRRDSVLAGVTWGLAPGAAGVVVVRRESPMISALRTQAVGARAPGAGFATSRPIRLSRIDCR